MDETTYNQIKETITPIVDKLGEMGTNGWHILVQGQIATGIADLVLSLFLFCIIGTLITFIFKMWKYPEKANKDEERNRSLPYDFEDYIVGLTIACGIIASFIFIFALVALYSAVMHLAAPEFKALEFVIINIAGQGGTQ